MRKLGWIVVAALATAPASGQVAPAPRVQQAHPMDARAVVTQVRRVLAENYVVVERRAALDKVLADGLASGRYDKLPPVELAERITADMAGVAHDKHLSLRFDPRAVNAPPRAAREEPSPQEIAEYEAGVRRDNFGIAELRVLPGNVRYMRYNGFMWTGPESAAALDGAMAFLMGGDAAIIDIRGNGGGSPEAVQHIVEYFVPPNTEIVRFHMRSEPVQSVSTGPKAPALGLWPKDKPVYVLTSGRAASAAEEFASHVARFKFAKMVGETTAGAAYRNEILPVGGGFTLSVSVGRPEIPGVGDWEGKGVAPDIAVPVDQALPRALQDAYGLLGTKAGDRKTDYEWMAAAQGALVTPAPLARPLEAYAGAYGPRTISVVDGALRYRRAGAMSFAMLPLGPDLFGLAEDSLTRVRFTIVGGQVTGFDLLRSDGTSVAQPRDPVK